MASKFYTPGYRNAMAMCKPGTSNWVNLPILPGTGFVMPYNYQIPTVISGYNVYQYNAVEGLQYATINLQTLVMRSWWAGSRTDLWQNWFPERATLDDVPDLSQTPGVTDCLKFWFGSDAGPTVGRGFTFKAGKVNWVRLGATQGDLIRLSMQILATGFTPIEAIPDEIRLISDAPAASQHVELGGALTHSPGQVGTPIVSWELALMNNLMPSPLLNSEVYPYEFNAGQFVATMRLVMPVAVDLPQEAGPGELPTSCDFTIKCPTDRREPPGTESDGVTIKVKNYLALDPRERTVMLPRQLKEVNYACLGQYLTGEQTMAMPVEFE